MATNGVAEQAEYFLPQCREAFDDSSSAEQARLSLEQTSTVAEHLEADYQRACGTQYQQVYRLRHEQLFQRCLPATLFQKRWRGASW